MCSAIDHGAARAEIEALIKTCDVSRPEKETNAAEALEAAAVALTDSNAVFTTQTNALARTLQLLGVLLAIGRLIQLIPNPAGRLAVVGMGALKVVAEGQLKKIAAQQAANDAAILVVRRAAANEAQFLLRAGR